MVVDVNFQNNISLALQDLNDLKEKISKATQTLAEQEKSVQKYQEESAKYQPDIEDIYEPSFDFNKTGTEDYSKNMNTKKLDIIEHASSYNEFCSYLTMQIEKDYADQHNSTDICASYSNDSVSKYISSIDYKKEYEEYKKSKGCSTDEELKLVVYSHCKTKDEMYDRAAGYLDRSIASVQDSRVIPHNIFREGINPQKLVKSASIQDIYNYINNDCDQHDVKGHVFTAQGFINLLSNQDNIDMNTRKALKGLSQDITFAKGAIISHSNEIDRINMESFHSKQQYNSSLISRYSS